jgi:CRP/FNR family cyclic AMP-dependent transcriptional regulator
MANASRQQVNAALQRFEKAGWLTSAYRSIAITNVEALRRFAEGDGED